MSNVDCAKKAAPAASDATIEEVSAKQLERLLEDKDYVAVYWCKCRVREGPGNPIWRTVLLTVVKSAIKGIKTPGDSCKLGSEW